MARDAFTPFSRNLNPFRGIERSIDTMFDDSFGAGAAGVVAEIQSGGGISLGDMPSRSLFLRVVQPDGGRRKA